MSAAKESTDDEHLERARRELAELQRRAALLRAEQLVSAAAFNAELARAIHERLA